MLHVLLESRAPRTRRVGSTVASALAHVALLAGAVLLTMPGPVNADGATTMPTRIAYVVPPVASRSIAMPPTRDDGLTAPRPMTLPTIAAPYAVPIELPPIDVGPVMPPDQILIGGHGVRTASPIGAGDPSLLPGVGSAIDERQVDRAPRLLGRARAPLYPASLRAAGVQGRVVVQFVVDTLGRAELGDVQVMESPHEQFVESVRAALAHYRFTVGEVGGRRVRTRVQLPFEFVLAK